MPMIIFVPKPRRVGFRTSGPSVSIHTRRTTPLSSPVQAMSSFPDGVENAPYLAALVLSSWIAADSASVSLGGSSRPGPLMVSRSGPA